MIKCRFSYDINQYAGVSGSTGGAGTAFDDIMVVIDQDHLKTTPLYGDSQVEPKRLEVMVSISEKIGHIHFEHMVWFNELQSYLEEIKVYLKRVQMLKSKYIDEELSKELETFRKRFESLSQQINVWQINIGKHEVNISELAKLDGALSQMTNSEHDKMRDQIKHLRRSMIELKEGFQFFMLERM